MRSTIYTSLALAAVAAAAPRGYAPSSSLSRRADEDATILNFALTLEHLEATFYAEGVKNFTAQDFDNAGFNGSLFYKNLQEVAYDEATHVTFLTTALKAAGATPVAACTYNFGNLTPKTFMDTASILEGVGVSAYLGAAALITSPEYLTAAASILTVEARHNAFVRSEIGQSPFTQPFDSPLDLDQVYTLAAAFITSCPSSNPALPVKAFPSMTLDQTCAVYQGRIAKFKVASGTKIPSGQLYIAYPLVTGPVFMNATVNGNVVSAHVPIGDQGPAGESYAILTSNGTSLTDNSTIAGPAVVNIIAPYLT